MIIKIIIHEIGTNDSILYMNLRKLFDWLQLTLYHDNNSNTDSNHTAKKNVSVLLEVNWISFKKCCYFELSSTKYTDPLMIFRLTYSLFKWIHVNTTSFIYIYKNDYFKPYNFSSLILNKLFKSNFSEVNRLDHNRILILLWLTEKIIIKWKKRKKLVLG